VSLASAKADAGAQRLGRPISIGVKGLRRMNSGTVVPFASAEADAWRAAPWEADFNRREGLRPAVGLHAE
jgi:hypothetical protein